MAQERSKARVKESASNGSPEIEKDTNPQVEDKWLQWRPKTTYTDKGEAIHPSAAEVAEAFDGVPWSNKTECLIITSLKKFITGGVRLLLY